jgi:hypothetical protein
MSLLVSVYREVAPGKLEDVGPQPRPAGGDPSLFGFEVCRTTLWGAPFTRALGLTLLPGLAEGNIYATGEDLLRLQQEAELLHQRIHDLSQATGYQEEFIEFRLQNLLGAIAQAMAMEGGAGWVYVW